jgi:hypothetical protein
MQASNMMWARPGWEARVLDTGRSLNGQEIMGPPAPDATGSRADAAKHPFYQSLVTHGMHAWLYHEGSYYPITDIEAFRTRLSAWIAQPSVDLQRDVLDATPYHEEFWLQLFVLNEQLGGSVDDLNSDAHQLCLRGADGAAVTSDLLTAVVAGTTDSPYWAVKRVERDVDDELVQSLRGPEECAAFQVDLAWLDVLLARYGVADTMGTDTTIAAVQGSGRGRASLESSAGR